MNRIKKRIFRLSIFILSYTFILVTSANAKLLGLQKTDPDLYSNTVGDITYTYTGTGVNILEIRPEASTKIYTEKDGVTEHYVLPLNDTWTTIAIYVDDHGNLLGGVPTSQPLVDTDGNGVGDTRYNDFKTGVIDMNDNYVIDAGEPGTNDVYMAQAKATDPVDPLVSTYVLIGADVLAFGWSADSIGNTRLEFVFDLQIGGIDEADPAFAKYPIGGIIQTESIVSGNNGLFDPTQPENANWIRNWREQPVKLDQFPTPEPSSFLLLGLSLMGFMGLSLRKKFY
jgi:hypothetical protein